MFCTLITVVGENNDTNYRRKYKCFEINNNNYDYDNENNSENRAIIIEIQRPEQNVWQEEQYIPENSVLEGCDSNLYITVFENGLTTQLENGKNINLEADITIEDYDSEHVCPTVADNKSIASSRRSSSYSDTSIGCFGLCSRKTTNKRIDEDDGGCCNGFRCCGDGVGRLQFSRIDCSSGCCSCGEDGNDGRNICDFFCCRRQPKECYCDRRCNRCGGIRGSCGGNRGDCKDGSSEYQIVEQPRRNLGYGQDEFKNDSRGCDMKNDSDSRGKDVNRQDSDGRRERTNDKYGDSGNDKNKRDNNFVAGGRNKEKNIRQNNYDKQSESSIKDRNNEIRIGKIKRADGHEELNQRRGGQADYNQERRGKRGNQERDGEHDNYGQGRSKRDNGNQEYNGRQDNYDQQREGERDQGPDVARNNYDQRRGGGQDQGQGAARNNYDQRRRGGQDQDRSGKRDDYAQECDGGRDDRSQKQDDRSQKREGGQDDRSQRYRDKQDDCSQGCDDKQDDHSQKRGGERNDRSQGQRDGRDNRCQGHDGSHDDLFPERENLNRSKSKDNQYTKDQDDCKQHQQIDDYKDERAKIYEGNTDKIMERPNFDIEINISQSNKQTFRV